MSESKLLQTLRTKYPKLYIAKFKHSNTRGQSMNFDKFRFLVEIYKSLEECPNVTIMKAAQVGVSEAFIVSHLVDSISGKSIQYVLPADRIRDRFVKNRINRVIQKTPYYLSMIDTKKGTDNISFKTFGKGVINYVGSGSKVNFVEFPSDVLYVDEYDKCDQHNILMGEDRMLSSDLSFKRYVSNPTISNFGIDIPYKKGTQEEIYYKCNYCNKWQKLDWFGNVVRKSEKNKDVYEAIQKQDYKDYKPVGITCIKCNKMDSIYNCKYEWVAKYKHRMKEHRSFSTSRLVIDDSYTEFMDDYFRATQNMQELQIFYNYKLGITFNGGDNRISESLLKNNIDKDLILPYSNSEGDVFAGIDIGSVHHVSIRKLKDGKLIPLNISYVDSESELIAILQRYSVKYAVVDALPEQELVTRLKKEIPYLYSCFFRDLKEPSIDIKTRTITIPREIIFDKFYHALKTGKIVYTESIFNIEDFTNQMTSNVRIFDKSRLKFIWQQSSHDDHYHLSECYNYLAYNFKSEIYGHDIFSMYENIDTDIENYMHIDNEIHQSSVKNILNSMGIYK